VLDERSEQAHGSRRDIAAVNSARAEAAAATASASERRPETIAPCRRDRHGHAGDEAGERQPGSLAGLFDRPNGRDQAIAQRHLERTAAPGSKRRLS